MEPSTVESRSVLVVDDDRDFAEGLEAVLRRFGYHARFVHTAEDAHSAMEACAANLALVDLKLATQDGLELIAGLTERWPQCLCILMTAYSSLDSAVEAIKVGAYDYLRKPFGMDALRISLDRAVDRIRADELRRRVERQLEDANRNLREINDRLEFIVTTAKELTEHRSLATLYPRLLSAYGDCMGAGGGSLYLVHPDHLELCCSLDPGHAPERIPLPMERPGVCAMVLEKGEPVLLEDISGHAGLSPSGWGGYRDPSVLAFPLQGAEGCTAAVVCLHSKDKPPFTRMDLDLGIILSGHMHETLRATAAFEALASSERKYRHLAEGSVQGICVFDASRFLFANPAFLSIFGVQDLEALGPIGEEQRYLPAGLTELATGRRAAPDGEEPDGPIARLVQVVDAEGTAKWVEAIARQVDWEERQAVQLTIVDVTPRVEAERRMRTQQRQLVQADKMAALGTLVSGVAHEINNPVNLIGLNVSLMGRIWRDLQPLTQQVLEDGGPSRVGGLPGAQIPATMERLIAGIDDASGRIQHIVTRLKDFSRQQEARQFEVVDVNAVVQSAIDLTRSAVNRATDDFRMKLGPGLPPVLGNPIELAQVLVNLITNACQAVTAPDQPIAVSSFGDPQGEGVVVEVRDGGRGIPAGQQDFIYDPFFTTKRDDGGTGLGLYVCYSIVREHQGRLELTSEPGAGTCVQMMIPAMKGV